MIHLKMVTARYDFQQLASLEISVFICIVVFSTMVIIASLIFNCLPKTNYSYQFWTLLSGNEEKIGGKCMTERG